jgi:hypothetical protein
LAVIGMSVVSAPMCAVLFFRVSGPARLPQPVRVS